MGDYLPSQYYWPVGYLYWPKTYLYWPVGFSFGLGDGTVYVKLADDRTLTMDNGERVYVEPVEDRTFTIRA